MATRTPLEIAKQQYATLGLETDPKLGSFTGSQEQMSALQNAGFKQTIPSTLGSEELTKPDVTIPQPQDKYGLTTQNVLAAGTTAQDFYTNLLKQQNAPTTSETERESLTSQYKAALEGVKGKSAEQVALQETLGVTENTKKLQDLNTQIAQLQTGLEKRLAEIPGQGRGLTTSLVQAQTDRERRLAAVEIGSLATVAQTLQGNITLAKQTAKETVDLKYADAEQEINNLKSLIDLNYQDMTAEQKKKADVLSIQLKAREEEISKEKEDKSNILNLAIKYPKAFSDAGINLDKDSFNTVMTKLIPKIEAEGNKGDWIQFTTSDGVDMKMDKNTGNVQPVVSETSGASFTDANGTSWNIEGWATDPTKATQMQSIADRIGKVDDSNIDAKVKQFTPGLTSDMIRETSAKTGVSWEALMTMVAQEDSGGISTNVKNNNNFGGLTWYGQQWIKDLGGTIGGARGVNGSESGNYVKFPTKQAGLDAMGILMAKYGTVLPKEQQIDNEVKSFVERVNSGKLTDAQALNEITPAKKKMLIEKLATTPKPTDETDIVAAKYQLSKIKEIETSSALNDAVGTTWFDRDWGMFDISKVTGDYQTFIGTVSNLTDQLSLDKLIESKKQGATFGALSDRELNMLANAATSINRWAKIKDGQVIGYNISEKSFKKELENIRTLYNRAIERKENTNYRTMSDGTVWQLNPDGTLTKI